MTVEVTSYFSGPYITNGATTVFPFSFISMDADELGVLLRDADGVDTVVSTSLYSVTRDADGTGSVVFSTAPASGSGLYIFSDVSFAQSVEFEDGSGWKAAPVNSVADRSAARDIWLKGKVDRAILAPLGEAPSELPSVDSRLGKYLAFDAEGNPVAADGTGPDGGLRSDLAASGGAALIGTIANGAGAVARTVQSKTRETISLADFTGFDNTGVGSINSCLAYAKTYCDTLTVTPDANGPQVRARLYIPPGTYKLTADAALPLEVECDGRFTGAFKLTQSNIKRAYIKGLSCPTLELSGVWFGTYEDIYADLLIDGGGVAFGTFWNSFNRIVGDVTIDLANWSVNQNNFNGRGNFLITGTGGDILDGHANNLDDWDFTGGTCLNDSSIQQTSLIEKAYYEGGADITGPFHVIGFQGDAEGPPKVGRRNHIFAAYDIIEKNRADFLSTGPCILAGGNWDDLDSTGKPPCLTAPGGATVTTDTTEPFRIGKKYGGTFTTAFNNFTITIPACPSGRFSLNIAYIGDDFTTIDVVRGGGGGTSSYTPQYVALNDGWKLMRISGNASTTATTVVTLFVFGGTGGSKTINIGGMYCSQEKAAQLPSPSYIRTARGTVTQGYVAAPPSVDIAVTFPKAFSATPQVTTSVVSTGAPSANFSKVLITSLSASGFTARVYYATDFQCELNWIAEGLN